MFRRRWLVVAALVLLALFVGAILTLRGRDLRTRSRQIVVGMTRAEVEAEFGPPVLDMGRSQKPGRLLVWTDQLWQLDIFLDGNDRVESVATKPSNSPYRQTVGKIIDLPQ